MYTRVYVYAEKILKAKGKLLLRGGIMRKSRNGQVRAFAAITKFWVLLMCFAVVFALVLTTGVLEKPTSRWIILLRCMLTLRGISTLA